MSNILNMKKYILLILVCLVVAVSTSRADSISDNESLRRLYRLSCRNLNYSSTTPESVVLKLCNEMEALARRNKDYENLFFVKQIIVNSYCLSGDVGMAVNEAQQMYEEAKTINLDIGLALSIQSMAVTYMYSNQKEQAMQAFEEAWTIMQNVDNDLFKIRLQLQQLHVCMLMEDAAGMQNYLNSVSTLLQESNIPDKDDYLFYIHCYHTFRDIAIGDSESVKSDIQKMYQMKTDDKLFDRWYYFMMCRYFELTGDYAKALTYCDSTKQVIIESQNMNEYKQLMLVEASLLTKNGLKAEACDLYNQARKLSDSLNMVHYSMQIDSLHVLYWVDQMELENAVMYSRFLRWSIWCGLLFVIITTILVYFAIKKNKKLVASRKDLELIRQETAESIHSKNLFLSNMSHELRTPLNAIVGFADILAQEIVEDKESKQQFGDMIKQNAELLMKLFNDVADLSVLKDKNIHFVLEDCDVIAMCHNVLSTVENVKRSDAELKFSTNTETLHIHTDSGRLQQVLINLLINATKFTPKGLITLSVDVDKESNVAIFKVTDTGCGIPLDKQPHIFARFEKLHEGVQGAGLGLSICKLIIDCIGGNIWIDPTYTDGACFVFTHPLQKQN